MTLNLGTLEATFAVDTSNADKALTQLDQRLADLEKTRDDLQRNPLKINADVSKDLDDSIKETKQLKTALEDVSKSGKISVDTGQLQSGLGKAGKDVAGFKAEADKNSKVTPDIDQGPLDRGLGDMMGKITRWAAGATAAFSAFNFAKGITEAGIEFQSQLNTMKAVSGATGEQLAAITQRARELGSATDLTATSASDAAGAMTELAKGGFTIEQSMSAAKGTLQLAAAAQIDAASAATIQSQALQSFGLNAAEAARVSDILAGAANASSAEIDGIAQGMQQAGTVSKQFGLTIDDTATALAMFANAGIQGSDAGTLLKSALLALTDQGKPAQSAIEELGLTVYDAQGNFVGLSNLMGQLKDAAARMTPEQYQAATATLFGSDAMRLAGIAAQQGSEGFDRLRESVTRQGQAAEVAAAQTEGLPGAMERFENTMEDIKLGVFTAVQDELVGAANAGVSLLEALTPAIEGMASAAAGGVENLLQLGNAVMGMPEPVKDLAGTALELGVALAALKVVPVVDVFDKMRSKMSDAKTSIADFASATNRAMVEASAAYQAQAGQLQLTAMEHRALAREATTTRTAVIESSLAMDAQWGSMVASMQAKGVALGAGIKSIGSAARTGLTNLVNALGGPLNLALAGGAIAVMDLVNANRSAEQAHENVAKAAREAAEAEDVFKLAVAGAAEAVDADGLAAAATIAKGSMAAFVEEGERQISWAEKMDYSVLGLSEVLTHIPGVYTDAGRALVEHQRQTKDTRDAYDALKATATDMGLSMEDVNKVVASGGDQYDQLLGKLREMGPEGERAANELQAARDELERMEQAARQLSPGMAEIGHSLDTIGDSASSAEDKLAAMKKLIDEMSGGTMGSQEALMELADTVEQVGEKFAQINPEDGFGAGLFTDEGLLNSQVGNARLLHEELSKLQDSFLTAGRSGVDLGAAYTENVAPALDLMAEKFGLSAEDVERLREQFGLMPEVVQTLVSLEGAPEAVQDMGELWALMEKAKDTDQTTFDVNAMTDEARANLEQLGFTVTELDNGNYKVTVDGDVEQAREGLQEVLSFADEAANKDIAIEALLNTAPLTVAAGEAQGVLDALAIANPSPQAELIIDKLMSGAQISHGELAMLAAESPKPVADLENNPLISKALQSKREVGSLDGMHAQTSADLEDNVSGKARGIKGLLDSIPKFIHTVFSSEGEPPQSRSGRFAQGGLIPRLAAGDQTHGGYQLPMTGPGTQTTDGILGLDAQGLATAWVDRGEYVTNRASTLKYLPLLEAINADNQAAILTAALMSVKKLAAGGGTGETGVNPAVAATPDGVEVGPITAQTGDAITDLTVVQEKLATVEAGAAATITADTSNADPAVAGVAQNLADLPSSTTVGVVADTSSADESVAGLQETLSETTAEPTTMQVMVDTEGLAESTTVAAETLQGLADMPVTAAAGLDTAPLDAGADAARANLNDVGAQRPVPVADLNTGPLMGGVAAADAELHRVGAAKSTSVADVDNSSALANIQGVINELNRMPVERVIKVVAHGSLGLAKGGEIPGLATGGTIAGTSLPTSGPGTAQVDGFLGVDGDGMPLVRVDAGEFVTNRKASQEYRRELELINAGLFPKLDNLDKLMAGAKKAPGLFQGGVVSPDQLLAFARGNTVRGVTPPGALEGSPYIWGGGLLANWGDCSGAMSGLAALATGADVNGRKFATMNEGAVLASMGFRPGIGPAETSFSIGWFNGGPWGGHTAGTIGGTNVEMGGGRGNGQVGGAAAGAASPQFTDHAWIPLGELVAFDYFNPLGPVTARRVPPGRGGYSPAGGLGVGLGGRGVGPGGAGVTLHDQGGWHQPGTFAFNGLTEPEPILSPATWRLVEQMIAVFPKATDVWVEAGKSLERAAAELTKISDTPAETAKAWRGLLDGKFNYENFLAAGKGQPLAGLGVTGRDVLGGGLSQQIESLASRVGAGAQATGALNSELMVNLAISDQTISAYNELEKAKQADEKAAHDVQEAEKKLTEAREKGSDTADAEAALAKARAQKVASATAVVDAQLGLQVAAVMGALDLLGEVTGRVSDAVVGGFEGAASGAALLADSIGRLAENMETAAKIADGHAKAQEGALTSAARLQKAVEAQREAERKARTEAQEGVRDTQAAEFDLRMTRWEASQVAGAAEADLQAAREQGIFDVFALATEADRKAMKSASDVLVSEARLAAVRAKAEQQDYENTLAVTTANNELELAQVMAGLEMDKLTAASYALAKAQAYASGELGGATALERYVKGVEKMAEANAKEAAGIATSVQAWLNPLRWFKGDTMKGAGMKSEAEAMKVEAQAIMDAYRDQMADDLARLSDEDRAAAEKALAELTNVATQWKMGGAGLYSVITGDDGKAVEITAEMAMRKATAELDRLMLKSQYGMEAAQLEADRKTTGIEREQRLAEMQAKQAELAQTLESWAKRDSMAELVALTEQQLAEHEQENKQLGGISGKLDDKKVSTIMSIGGAGWGGPAGVAEPAGGFGGVNRGDLSLWETARMEDGWLDREIARVLVPATDTIADAAAAAGKYPTGLPDTVVDGYYRGPVEGAANALRDAARRSETELEANTTALRELAARIGAVPTAPTVGTQYTGPVTVQSTEANRLARDLSSALTRA